MLKKYIFSDSFFFLSCIKVHYKHGKFKTNNWNQTELAAVNHIFLVQIIKSEPFKTF